MIEFTDATFVDLARATKFLHYIKPALKSSLVYAIEKAQPLDQNVVFHLVERGEIKDDEREKSIFMLSAEYIIEHSYWKELTND